MSDNQIINPELWKTQDCVYCQFCCNDLDVLYGHNAYMGFVNDVLLWSANFEELAYQKLARRYSLNERNYLKYYPGQS